MSSINADTTVHIPRILLVDDDLSIRLIYSRTLESKGLRVDACESAEHGCELLRGGASYSAVITDLSMPGMSGSAFLQMVRGLDPDVEMVVVTGQPTLSSSIAALEMGTCSYLVKPVALQVLCESVFNAAAKCELSRLKRRALELCESDGWRTAADGTLDASFACALDGLFMVYQPIVESGGTVFGYEALVRTTDPTLSSPDRLFSAGERLGRTRELGRRIRSLVSKQIDAAPPGSVLLSICMRAISAIRNCIRWSRRSRATPGALSSSSLNASRSTASRMYAASSLSFASWDIAWPWTT